MNAVCKIAPLTTADAATLSALLKKQRADYMAYFHPFAFDEATIARQLAAAREDQFWLLRVDGELAGFFMLRGWDAGFVRPAFGIFVAEEFSGRGFAHQALDFSIDYCRARGTRALMLSVHPSNKNALHVYESAGFRRTGERSKKGNDIYELPL